MLFCNILCDRFDYLLRKSTVHESININFALKTQTACYKLRDNFLVIKKKSSTKISDRDTL